MFKSRQPSNKGVRKHRTPSSRVPYSPWQVHVCFLLEEALFMSSFKKEMSPIFHFLLCATLTNQIFPSLPFSYCFIYHHCVSGRFARGCFRSLSGGNLSAQCVQIGPADRLYDSCCTCCSAVSCIIDYNPQPWLESLKKGNHSSWRVLRWKHRSVPFFFFKQKLTKKRGKTWPLNIAASCLQFSKV